MKRDKVVFRVDINANQGLGHYKRCYVLAQHFLMQGWKVYFLMECPCPNADIKTTGINFRYLFDTKNTNAKLTQADCFSDKSRFFKAEVPNPGTAKLTPAKIL